MINEISQSNVFENDEEIPQFTHKNGRAAEVAETVIVPAKAALHYRQAMDMLYENSEKYRAVSPLLREQIGATNLLMAACVTDDRNSLLEIRAELLPHIQHVMPSLEGDKERIRRNGYTHAPTIDRLGITPDHLAFMDDLRSVGILKS